MASHNTTKLPSSSSSSSFSFPATPPGPCYFQHHTDRQLCRLGDLKRETASRPKPRITNAVAVPSTQPKLPSRYLLPPFSFFLRPSFLPFLHIYLLLPCAFFCCPPKNCAHNWPINVLALIDIHLHSYAQERAGAHAINKSKVDTSAFSQSKDVVKPNPTRFLKKGVGTGGLSAKEAKQRVLPAPAPVPPKGPHMCILSTHRCCLAMMFADTLYAECEFVLLLCLRSKLLMWI
jgi:hypothetical protein